MIFSGLTGFWEAFGFLLSKVLIWILEFFLSECRFTILPTAVGWISDRQMTGREAYPTFLS